MLASNGHSYTARVARDIAGAGWCAAKRTRFAGVRLHFITKRRRQRLPLPSQVILASAEHHEVKVVKDQQINLPDTDLFADLAFCDKQLAF